MPRAAYQMCGHSGCSALLEKAGYCDQHEHLHQQNKRDSFRVLDQKKSQISKKFYSSSRWTKASIAHRKREPLCRKCKEMGIVKMCDLVHHNPDLDYLLANGLNPFLDKYLESICTNHHLEELREKKGVKQDEKIQI